MRSVHSLSCGFLAASLAWLPASVAQSPGLVSMTVYGPLLEPVPNAEVVIRRPDWSQLQRGKTDGSGQFFFTGEEGRWVYCCASAPGMHEGCEITPPLTAKNSPVHLDIKLFAAAAIRGTVRDESGKAIAGAQVIAVMDNAPLMLFKGEPEVATSDAQGAFVLSRTPLGEVAVRVSAEDFELGESQIYLREDAGVDVVLKKGQGRKLVVVAEGVPVDRLPDIECRFFASRPFPRPSMALPPRLVRAHFDEKGQCVVRGLPKEVELSMVRLEAGGMRFQPQWHKVAAGEDGKVTFKLDAILGPRPVAGGREETQREPPKSPDPSPVPQVVANPTLRGVLRGEDGKPCGLMRVRMYCEGTGWREAVTAEDGTFAVDAEYKRGDKIAFELRNPDWVLAEDERTQAKGFGGSIWREYAPGVVQSLVVAAAAKVRGKVDAPRGYSAAGLRVLLEVGGPDTPRMFESAGTTDGNGAFVIDGLRPPEGQVWLVIRGLQGTAEAGPFKFDGRKELEDVTLKLEPPQTVTGTVIGKSGKPVPGARVTLAAWAGKGSAPSIGGNVTLADAQGRFAFSGMKEGSYTLEVIVRGLDVAARGKPFEVGGKQRPSDQMIKLPTD